MKDKHVLYAHKKGYRVTEDGRVFAPSGKERKLRVGSTGYWTFSVRSRAEGVDGPCLVHKLAALQWFGASNFKPGIQVRHLDGNPLNNRRENLALGTGSQNMMDRPATERRAHAKKAAKARRAFTDGQVRTIRKRKANGESLKTLAAEYGVANSTISYIVNRKMYQEVT